MARPRVPWRQMLAAAAMFILPALAQANADVE